MSQSFAVPCAKCRRKPDNYRHTEQPPKPLTHGEAAIYHDYAPNERSVEWAALKLREALDKALPYLTWVSLHAPGVSTHSSDRADDVAWEAKAALRLADTVGIEQSESSP